MRDHREQWRAVFGKRPERRAFCRTLQPAENPTPNSFQTALDGMAKEEINAKWQEFMAPYFEGIGGKHADESMVELEEVFHLD